MTTLINFLNCNLLFFGFLFFLGFLFLVTALLTILTESSVHSILYLMFLFLYLTELTIVLKMEFLALIFIIVYIGAVCVLMLFHIKLIKTFVHRFDNLHSKDLFLPFLIVSIVLPLIQIITLSLEIQENETFNSFSIIKSLPNYLDLEVSQEITFPISNDICAFIWNNVSINNSEILSFYSKYNIFNTFHLNQNSYFSNEIHFNYTHWVDLFDTFKSTQILGFLLYNIYFIYLIFGSFILLIAMIGSIFLTLSERKDKKFQKLDKQIFTDIYNSIFLNR